MIRIALAGCGEHSRASHAAPLARYAAAHAGEVELVAACGKDEAPINARLRKEAGQDDDKDGGAEKGSPRVRLRHATHRIAAALRRGRGGRPTRDGAYERD